MNAVVEMKARPSVLEAMAERYGMMPAAFEATVRATCTPQNTTREEFAAFLLVAKEYNLNPLTKEIYAFPKRGGGIVPIVSVDGWVSLVNSHTACDGFEFDFDHGEDKELISCTCRMFRKDRSRPVTVTEYLTECIRPTDPWKMRHRMLRHKAMIQAARYAFGFSGIYDEDEGAKIAEMRDVTPSTPPAPPEPPRPPETAQQRQDEAMVIDHDEPVIEATTEAPEEIVDDTTFFERLEDALAVAMDAETVEEIWDSFDPLARFEGQPQSETNQSIAVAIKKRALKRVGGET